VCIEGLAALLLPETEALPSIQLEYIYIFSSVSF
jgi:hypothetical protein